MADYSFQKKFFFYVLLKRSVITYAGRPIQPGVGIHSHPGRYARAIIPMIMIILIASGCAQFQHELPAALPFLDRAQTQK